MKASPTARCDRRTNDTKLVLVLAFPLLFGSVLLLFASQPLVAYHQSYRWSPSVIALIPPGLLHFFGFAGLIASSLLFRLYFRLRRQRLARTTGHNSSSKSDKSQY